MSNATLERLTGSLPEQFRDKRNITAFLSAISEELEELRMALEQMNPLRSMDQAEGKNLDGIGEIVVLDRDEAREMLAWASDSLTDELYRVILRFKSLKNLSACSIPEILNMCHVLYQATSVKYTEDARFPAHFGLTVGTGIALEIIELMAHAKMMVKPGGVSVDLAFHPADFFGFCDINPKAKGFGEGKFAQMIT